MQPNPFPSMNIQTIRRALRNWNSLKELAANPLTKLQSVEEHRKTTGYTDSTTGRGLALREILKNAILSLRPADPRTGMQDKRWRPFLILNGQFIEGRSPEFLQEQLHIARGTYFAEQSRALERLVDALIRLEEQQSFPHTSRSDAPESIPIPFLAPPHPAFPFIGRDCILAALKKELASNAQVTTALNGLPGVGKTRIALELAYDAELRSVFSDGVLWAGLGCKPDIMALLGVWAAALNIPPETIAGQSNLSDRIALVHAAIGSRKMLLIIDDAWQSEAGLAFKLGGPNCAHLLTTRLLDVAVDFAGEHVLTVREMEIQEGLDLLSYFSPDLLAANPTETQSLVQSVGSLPLGIILMGRYLQKYTYKAQSRRLNEALTALKQSQHRLSLSQQAAPLELNPGIPAGTPLSLQAVIGLSDSILDPTAHQALIALAAFPPKPNHFSEEAALAVSGVQPVSLDTLVDIGLVECLPPDRYTLHQTIADYAHLQAENNDAALKLIEYFTIFAENNKTLYPNLDQEMVNLLYACEAAHQIGQHTHLIQLTNVLYDFLETRGLYAICKRLLEKSLEAAHHLENAGHLAATLYSLGDLEVRRGEFEPAKKHLQQSIELCQLVQNHYLETSALFALGTVNIYSGDWMEGLQITKRSLAEAQKWGFQNKEDWVLSSLGYICSELCEFQTGLDYLDQALQVCERTGNQRVIGWTHFNYSLIYLATGNIPAARHHADQCGIHYRVLGDLRGETWLIYHYGRIARQEGDFSAADRYFEESLGSFQKLGDGMGLGFAMHNRGLVAAELGDWAAAISAYQQALEIFQKIGCGTGESQCYQSLGELYRQRSEMKTAKFMLQKALVFRQKNNYQRGIAKALANLSLIDLNLGEKQTANTAAHQAVQIAEEIGAQPTLAYALVCLGEVALAGEDHRLAETAFQRACIIRQTLGQRHWLWEPLAGLARSAYLAGDLPRALSKAAEALAILDEAPRPGGVNRPELVYDLCKKIQSIP